MRPVLLVAFLVSVAHADVISPSQAACSGKAVGDECEGGACASSKCSRYSLQPDGTRTATPYDCLECVAGAPVTGGDGTARIAIGAGIAVVLVAGGVLLAYRRSKRGNGDVLKS